MSTCPKCNIELKDDFSFCPECGSRIGKSPAFCTCCGKEIDESNSFCPYCGAKKNECAQVMQADIKPKEQRVSLKNAIISLVMATIMPIFTLYSFMPFFCFFFFPGVILFYCLTIRFANLYENEAKRTIGFTNASRVVALVCLILGIILFIVGIVLTFLFYS